MMTRFEPGPSDARIKAMPHFNKVFVFHVISITNKRLFGWPP